MKDKLLVLFCILVFGGIGIYLTFFLGNTSKYDKKATAYRMENNESTDSEGTITYSPTYYFKVKGKEYQCETQTRSSIRPNEKKNLVYYNSKNPEQCTTEYSKTSSKTGGIICLVVAGIIILLVVVKPSSKSQPQQEIEMTPEEKYEMERKAETAIDIIEKVTLIYKRIVIGIIILIVLILTILDCVLLKQTIKARNYIDTIASLVSEKEEDESTVFDDYIYTFKDKKGVDQEIIVSISQEKVPEQEIKIKYNENNPEDFYEDGSTLDKNGIIWFIVKIVILILLLVLFFNKRLLNKIGISFSRKN